MRYLFDNKFYPVANCIGLIPLPASHYSQLYYDGLINASIHRRLPIKRYEALSRSLEENLAELNPVAKLGLSKDLFVALKNGWTAHFDNGLVSSVSLRTKANSVNFGFEGVSVSCKEDTLRKTQDGYRGAYGIVELTTYNTYTPHENQRRNIKRLIHVRNDGSTWNFRTAGDPLPFEEAEQYQVEDIRNRFTSDMLVRYLAHMDLYPFEEEFYLPEAYIIETEPVFKVTGTITLEEIQAML